uniref:Uncharacterized protein n=1 Tax=Arundo donax TaxID=35708 RepID=A0A0A9DUX9_ARUDO
MFTLANSLNESAGINFKSVCKSNASSPNVLRKFN